MRYSTPMRCALLGAVALAALAGLGRNAAEAQSLEPSERGLQLLPDESSYLDLATGVFNVQAHRSPAVPEARVEFRYGQKLLYFGPAAGLLVNTKGGVFGYGGIYTDIAWNRLVLTPLGAVGFYRRGSGEDLGGSFQFRISATIAYEFDDHSRIGVQFAHISNAGIHTHNPGDNEWLATYAIPLPF